MIEIVAAAVAAILNRADQRSLFMALLVGFSVCAPISPDGFTVDGWYLTVCAIDLFVCICALLSAIPAWRVIARIHFCMAGMHLFEWQTSPFMDGPSLYEVAIPSLEMTSLAIICFTSILFNRGYHGIVAGRAY